MNRKGDQPEVRKLIKRAAVGDMEAFGELYELYFDKVFRHIYYLTGNSHTAEDLTAQTFLKALEAMSRYEIRDVPFVAWLLRIGYNLAVNHKKIRGNRVDRLPQWEFPDERQRPEAVVETQEEAKWAQQMVESLRGDYQRVIEMFFIEGLDLLSIAKALGKRIGTVRTIKCRAIVMMRQAAES